LRKDKRREDNRWKVLRPGIHFEKEVNSGQEILLVAIAGSDMSSDLPEGWEKVAKKVSDYGIVKLAIVDCDGAMDKAPCNTKLVKKAKEQKTWVFRSYHFASDDDVEDERKKYFEEATNLAEAKSNALESIPPNIKFVTMGSLNEWLTIAKQRSQVPFFISWKN